MKKLVTMLAFFTTTLHYGCVEVATKKPPVQPVDSTVEMSGLQLTYIRLSDLCKKGTKMNSSEDDESSDVEYVYRSEFGTTVTLSMNKKTISVLETVDSFRYNRLLFKPNFTLYAWISKILTDSSGSVVAIKDVRVRDSMFARQVLAPVMY